MTNIKNSVNYYPLTVKRVIYALEPPMDSIRSKFIDEMALNNSGYLQAKNADFAAHPEWLYLDIRRKVAEALNLSKDWSKDELRSTIKSLNREVDLLMQGKQSAIFNWARVTLKKILNEIDTEEKIYHCSTILYRLIHDLLERRGDPKALLEQILSVIKENYFFVIDIRIGQFFHMLGNLNAAVVKENADLLREIIILLQGRINDPGLDLSLKTLSLSIYGLRTVENGIIPDGFVDGTLEKIGREQRGFAPEEAYIAMSGLARLDMGNYSFSNLSPVIKKLEATETPLYFENVVQVATDLCRSGGKALPTGLFDLVAKKLGELQGQIGHHELTEIIYGLRNLSAVNIGKKFLPAVAAKVDRSSQMNEKEVGMCFYGLRNLDGKTVPRELLEFLLGQLKGLTEPPTEKFLSMVFFGLKSMYVGDYPPEILDVLSEKVKQCECDFDSHSFASIFRGLKGNAESLLTPELAENLVGKLEKTAHPLDIRALDTIVNTIRKTPPSYIPPRFWKIFGRKISEMKEKVIDTVIIANIFAMLKDVESKDLSRDLMFELTARLYQGTEDLSGYHITSILGGIGGLDPKVIPSELLLVIAFKLDSCRIQIDEGFVFSVAEGLRSMDAKIVPRELFLVITKKMKSVGRISQRTLSKFFFSLKNYDDYAVPPELIDVLTEKLAGCQEKLTMVTCCMVLHGLGGVSENLVKPELLELVYRGIAESTDKPTMSLFSMAFQGLRNLGSKLVTEKLTTLLMKKLDSCEEKMRPADVAVILGGMQNLDNSSMNIDSFKFFAGKMAAMNEKIDASYLCSALYGLQGMDSRIVPLELLEEFYVRLCEHEEHLEERSVCDALYGIQNMKNPAADKIRHLLMGTLGKNKDVCIWDRCHIMRLMQALSLSNMGVPPWLNDKYRECVDSQSSDVSPFPHENKIRNVLKWVLPGKIMTNYFIDGFEMDFYYPDLKLNLELDGRDHVYKRTRDERRDKYLAARHGIKTLRFTLNEGEDLRSELTALLKPYIDRYNARQPGGRM